MVPTLTAGRVCSEQGPLTPLTWEGLHASQVAATVSVLPQWKDAVLTGSLPAVPLPTPHL